MDVVFSAPFSGAIYQWLEECLRAEGKREGPAYNETAPGYYRHALRGATATRPQALASLVMLDEIFIAAGDFAAPDSMRRDKPLSKLPGRRFGADLGISIGPNLRHEASQLLGSSDDVVELSREPEFEGLFPGMTDGEVWLEIVDAVADSMLIGMLHRPLVCGEQRRLVVNALISVGVITQAMIFANNSPLAGMKGDPLAQGNRINDVIAGYEELEALEFDAPTIGVLARVKDNKWVRESAEAFQIILAGSATEDTRAELRDKLRSAVSIGRYANPVGRIVNLASYSLSVASLFPGPGTAAGLASLALPTAAASLAPITSNASWFEIGSRMRYAASIAKLQSITD